MYPSQLRYTTEHEWVARVAPEVMRFGITDYAASVLGDVVLVELPEIGSILTGGDPCGIVESTKSIADLYSPVDGKVIAVNSDLFDTPELVNSEPYGGGWMVEIRLSHEQAADEAFSALLDSTQYQAQLS